MKFLKPYLLIIVLRLGSVIDSAWVLGQWVNGRTTESLVESAGVSGSDKTNETESPNRTKPKKYPTLFGSV
jgi:hypothetical protein